MKKIQYIISIFDNKVYVYDQKKDKVYKSVFKSLKQELIIELFIEEWNRFMKTNSMKVTLFGLNILFIKNENIPSLILNTYKEIWKEYFHKIELIDIKDIVNMEKEKAYLFIHKDYIDYYFSKKQEKYCYRIYLNVFQNQVEKAIRHIYMNLYKPKRLMVLGEDNISKIAEEIHKTYKIDTTFPEKYYYYLFEECKI